MRPQHSRVQQIERALREARGLRSVNVPLSGWLKALREAMGIPLRAQAAKAGIRAPTLLISERNEASGAITLNQLRRIGEVMDCELVYALVPRQKLMGRVERRAEEVARAEILGLSHSMALENQRPDAAFVRKQIEQRKRQLLEGNWARLWR